MTKRKEPVSTLAVCSFGAGGGSAAGAMPNAVLHTTIDRLRQIAGSRIDILGASVLDGRAADSYHPVVNPSSAFLRGLWRTQTVAEDRRAPRRWREFPCTSLGLAVFQSREASWTAPVLRRFLTGSYMALLSCSSLLGAGADSSAPGKGVVKADSAHPKHFPHRIWAACDFEGQTPDYGWFGRTETNDIPRYPGNATALAAAPGPYRDFSAVMTGVNPVPGPRMGKVNQLFVRYHLTGGSEAILQHFSLTREDNWHIRATGLETGRWASVALNFTSNAVRNDGSPEPFVDGERMDDFKMFAGKAADAARHRLLIDDVIFFADDPVLPPEPEPFPNRVIFLASFDTGPKEKYWPGDFELVEKPPAAAFWRAARAVPRRDGKSKLIRLQIAPPRPVGAYTKLRFRYHLTGTTNMTVQIFDATVQDNRHVHLRQLKQDEWTTRYVDFSHDSRRNDGTVNSPFTAGNKVDDLFFFVRPDGDREVE